jgi:C-terminal processing protease CtpA/Prc
MTGLALLLAWISSAAANAAQAVAKGGAIRAAEIAADAPKSIGRAKFIGEQTPGVRLASNLFDIPGRFHLRVAIAGYYSIRDGRLEGVGVTPDVSRRAKIAHL